MIRWYIKLLPFFVIIAIAKKMNMPWRVTNDLAFGRFVHVELSRNRCVAGKEE